MKQEGKSSAQRLSTCGLGAAFGILWGAYLFLLALLPNLGVIYFNQGALAMVQALIPWYVAGIGGTVVGLITGLICGFVCGFVVAWLYNKIAAKHACRACAG